MESGGDWVRMHLSIDVHALTELPQAAHWNTYFDHGPRSGRANAAYQPVCRAKFTGQCKDKIAHCASHMKNGGCKATHSARDHYRTNCVKTCGYCDDYRYNGQCQDKIAHCASHMKNGGCKATHSARDHYRTNCVKTCGYCNDPRYNEAIPEAALQVDASMNEQDAEASTKALADAQSDETSSTGGDSGGQAVQEYKPCDCVV